MPEDFTIFDNLSPDKVLKIHTQNSVYLIALVDKGKKLVAIQGGSYFPESRLVTLTGSSPSIESSCLLKDRAAIGFGLEIWRDLKKYARPRIVTSPIKFLSLVEKPELAEQLRAEAKALS